MKRRIHTTPLLILLGFAASFAEVEAFSSVLRTTRCLACGTTPEFKAKSPRALPLATTKDPSMLFLEKESEAALDRGSDRASAIVNIHESDGKNFIQRFLAAGGGNDPIGTRGESYFFVQAALIVAIAIGGVPGLSNLLLLLAGPGLLLMGIVILVISVLDMGESISPWPKPNGNGLIQDGLYGVVRHPMYFGLLATMTGFSVATNSMSRLLLTLLLLGAIEIKTDDEEEHLKKVYAGDYEEYQKKVTSKFIPIDWNDLGKKQKENKYVQ